MYSKIRPTAPNHFVVYCDSGSTKDGLADEVRKKVKHYAKDMHCDQDYQPALKASQEFAKLHRLLYVMLPAESTIKFFCAFKWCGPGQTEKNLTAMLQTLSSCATLVFNKIPNWSTAEDKSTAEGRLNQWLAINYPNTTPYDEIRAMCQYCKIKPPPIAQRIRIASNNNNNNKLTFSLVGPKEPLDRLSAYVRETYQASMRGVYSNNNNNNNNNQPTPLVGPEKPLDPRSALVREAYQASLRDGYSNNNNNEVNNNNNNESMNIEGYGFFVRAEQKLDIPVAKHSLKWDFVQLNVFAPNYLVGSTAGLNSLKIVDLTRNVEILDLRSPYGLPLKSFVFQNQQNNFIGVISGQSASIYDLENANQITHLLSSPTILKSTLFTTQYISSAHFFTFNNHMHLALGGNKFLSVFVYPPNPMAPRAGWMNILDNSIAGTITSIGFGLENRLVSIAGPDIIITNMSMYTYNSRMVRHCEGAFNIQDCAVDQNFVLVSDPRSTNLYAWDKETENLDWIWRQQTTTIVGLGLIGGYAYYAEAGLPSSEEGGVLHLLTLNKDATSPDPDEDHATLEVEDEITGISAIGQHILMTTKNRDLYTIKYAE